MEIRLRKRLVGALLHCGREMVLKAWEDHGGVHMPQPVYVALHKAVTAIMDAEVEVYQWKE